MDLGPARDFVAGFLEGVSHCLYDCVFNLLDWKKGNHSLTRMKDISRRSHRISGLREPDECLR